MQQPSLAQYLINWLEQDLTQQYGTQWENIPDDESQYLYIPNKENPRTVIRLADHLCSLYEFTKHIKEEQNVLFKSIVFKEINYAGNTNGLWDAEGQEIVFENVDEVYEHYYDVLPKIENDIIKVINEGGDYTDSTGMADVHPIKVTNIVRKDGKVKLSWDGTGEDPLIKYKKEHNIKESKTNKNMKKNVVKINENTLRQIVAESVKKVLREWDDKNDEYWRDEPTIYDTVANIKVYSTKADAVAKNAFEIEDGDAKRKELDSLQNWWFPTLYTYCKSFVETWEKMRSNM